MGRDTNSYKEGVPTLHKEWNYLDLNILRVGTRLNIMRGHVTWGHARRHGVLHGVHDAAGYVLVTRDGRCTGAPTRLCA